MDNTDLGLNLEGGVEFRAGRFNPKVGIRVELDGGEGWAIFGTLPFDVGG